MFRISQYMQEIAAPTPLGPKRNPPGPVGIWNLIRRCNLTCKHCYSISADTNFPGELTTEQVYTVMDDLKGFKRRITRSVMTHPTSPGDFWTLFVRSLPIKLANLRTVPDLVNLLQSIHDIKSVHR